MAVGAPGSFDKAARDDDGGGNVYLDEREGRSKPFRFRGSDAQTSAQPRSCATRDDAGPCANSNRKERYDIRCRPWCLPSFRPYRPGPSLPLDEAEPAV